jgi:hypothetical protein
MGSGGFDCQGFIVGGHRTAGQKIQTVEGEHGLPVEFGRSGVVDKFKAGSVDVSASGSKAYPVPLC